jgi:hypothetical protein
MSNRQSSGLNSSSAMCNVSECVQKTAGNLLIGFHPPPLKHCRRKPRYTDGATVHPYCGISCAAAAMSLTGPAPRNNPSGPPCQTPGCSSSVFIDPTSGVASKFCTKRHRWCVSPTPTVLPHEQVLSGAQVGKKRLCLLSPGSAQRLSHLLSTLLQQDPPRCTDDLQNPRRSRKI